MTILQSLYQYYERMSVRGEVDPYGFTRENISFAVVLSKSGNFLDVIDIRKKDKNKFRSVKLPVPQPNRTSNIQSNFLWDKTAYAFGVDSGKSKRLAAEHDSFKSLHRDLLSNINDVHAKALLSFIEQWQPGNFSHAPFGNEMLDHSFVFRIDGEQAFIHETPALRDVWLRHFSREIGKETFCLVSGRTGPLELGHPILKGVNGAQTSGAYLVSFNAPAFTSYGAVDGANAPTSEEAAFRYGAALNRMLDRGSANRLKRTVADATVVFWADTSPEVDEAAAKAAEAAFQIFIEPPEADPDDDPQETVKVRDALDKLADGCPIEDLKLGLVEGTRFHVLGLAPNAARLSVRYWLDDTFDTFAERLRRHAVDLKIEPRPRGWTTPKRGAPSVNLLLMRTTALLGESKNIPPLLAGEVMRAVLGGGPYPRMLLTAAITRLRAGDDPGTGWHAAVIKACLNRPIELDLDRLRREGADPERRKALEEKRLAVALEPNREKDPACHLGRLFAVLESAQYAALGRVNAPIGDRYYAAASSTPARVFGTLLRGLKNHVADARKRGQGGWIEPRVAEIVNMLPADLPRTLKLEDQGRFAVGYYHERVTRKGSAEAGEVKTAEGEKDGGDAS